MEQAIAAVGAVLGLLYCAVTTAWMARGMPDEWPRPWGRGTSRDAHAHAHGEEAAASRPCTSRTDVDEPPAPQRGISLTMGRSPNSRTIPMPEVLGPDDHVSVSAPRGA